MSEHAGQCGNDDGGRRGAEWVEGYGDESGRVYDWRRYGVGGWRGKGRGGEGAEGECEGGGGDGGEGGLSEEGVRRCRKR